MSESIENVKEIVKYKINSDEGLPYTINVDLIDSRSGKIIDLLENTINDNRVVTLNSQYYYFKFKKPIYIHKVNFIIAEDVNLSGMELIGVDISNNKKEVFFKKDQTIWEPNKIIKEFKIKPKKISSRKVKLHKIEMFGFTIEDIECVKDRIYEVKTYKSDLKQELDELIQKEKDFNNNKDEFNQLNEEIPELQENKIALEEKISNLENQRKSLKEDNQTLKDSASQLQTKSNSLNKDIPLLEQKIKKLTADKNIFSTEMAEYIKQANQHITIYFFLSLTPWILIACISYLVFNKTAGLSTIYNLIDDIDVFIIFWTRLPFALITISILFVSYEISKVFVQNMMKIQSQKRVFAKIGIVAKDVADSSILELKGLTDSERFELRTKLKMDLLKAHLSNDIGENYEYKIKTSLFSHLPELFSKKT